MSSIRTYDCKVFNYICNEIQVQIGNLGGIHSPFVYQGLDLSSEMAVPLKEDVSSGSAVSLDLSERLSPREGLILGSLVLGLQSQLSLGRKSCKSFCKALLVYFLLNIG